MSRLMTLQDAVRLIPDGAAVAVGGNTFHRVPHEALHEMVRQNKRGLTLIKTAGAYDVDLMAGAGLLHTALVAYVGFETMGLAPRFRREAEAGRLQVQEHT